ncbi:unnamed protein product [Dovyalis caffra]|uniref:Uncharacterized protein n=1 Tax=Dovyalis caffra TaxID=77055 RepID=A0AAV1R5V8_9ROSI|nr:unnamed protein product [Dovyalis caffra]
MVSGSNPGYAAVLKLCGRALPASWSYPARAGISLGVEWLKGGSCACAGLFRTPRDPSLSWNNSQSQALTIEKWLVTVLGVYRPYRPSGTRELCSFLATQGIINTLHVHKTLMKSLAQNTSYSR